MLLQRFFGFPIFTIILIIVIFIFISILFLALFLKIALSLVRSINTHFIFVFITALYCALIGWIPIIGWVLSWVIINARHETGFLVAILVWLLTFVIGFLVVWAISFFLFGI